MAFGGNFKRTLSLPFVGLGGGCYIIYYAYAYFTCTFLLPVPQLMYVFIGGKIQRHSSLE